MDKGCSVSFALKSGGFATKRRIGGRGGEGEKMVHLQLKTVLDCHLFALTQHNFLL
jgi:hypothetical protein